MSISYHLPIHDDRGFCNVLLSALGGDGANMAGKLLFKIGCTHFGLDGGFDARYGSEKKGTPTDVSVRFCEIGTPVRQSGPTVTPNVLVVFHDDLIAPLDLGCGLLPNAICIVNTIKPPEVIRSDLHLHSGKIICVDATRIAYQCKSRLNMPLVAILCHELTFPDAEVRDLITKQWPRAAEANLAAFSAAMVNCAASRFEANGHPLSAPIISRGPIGWANMLNGGTVDALTHTTIDRDNRVAGRGRVPKFDPAACNSCGICLSVCSDPGGLLWRQGRMEGIDESFCKGCMRCVEVCPSTKKGKGLSFYYA
jgi:pyruvate ferredoxin oxidoreductase gamma subunit